MFLEVIFALENTNVSFLGKLMPNAGGCPKNVLRWKSLWCPILAWLLDYHRITFRDSSNWSEMLVFEPEFMTPSPFLTSPFLMGFSYTTCLGFLGRQSGKLSTRHKLNCDVGFWAKPHQGLTLDYFSNGIFSSNLPRISREAYCKANGCTRHKEAV